MTASGYSLSASLVAENLGESIWCNRQNTQRAEAPQGEGSRRQRGFCKELPDRRLPTALSGPRAGEGRVEQKKLWRM